MNFKISIGLLLVAMIRPCSSLTKPRNHGEKSRSANDVFDNDLVDDLVTLMSTLKMNVQAELDFLTDDTSRFFLHGQLACTCGQVDKALNSLALVTKLDPSLPFAHLLIGRIKLGQGHWKDCIESYQRHLRISPSDLESVLGIRLAFDRWQDQQNSPHHSVNFPQFSSLPEAHFQLDTVWYFVDLSVCQAFHLELSVKGLKVQDVCRFTTFLPLGSIAIPRAHNPSNSLVPMQSDWINQQYLQPNVNFDKGSVRGGINNGASGNTRHLREFFADHHYVVINGMVTPSALELLVAWGKQLWVKQRLAFEASLKRHTESSDACGMLAAHQLLPLISAIVGPDHDLVPTYNFWIRYGVGGEIAPHRDRSQNQYSVTLNVKCAVEWPLYVYPNTTIPTTNETQRGTVGHMELAEVAVDGVGNIDDNVINAHEQRSKIGRVEKDKYKNKERKLKKKERRERRVEKGADASENGQAGSNDDPNLDELRHKDKETNKGDKVSITKRSKRKRVGMKGGEGAQDGESRESGGKVSIGQRGVAGTKEVAVHLGFGDAVLYMGSLLLHGRLPLPEAQAPCYQLIIGYRDVHPSHCNSQ